MRRVLATVKFFPLLLCGVLVVAWILSVREPHFKQVANYDVGFFEGTFEVNFRSAVEGPLSEYAFIFRPPDIDGRNWQGRLSVAWDIENPRVCVPVLLLLTCLLPISIGFFNRFRFPLWSYFAWTALIAAELAFYVR